MLDYHIQIIMDERDFRCGNDEHNYAKLRFIVGVFLWACFFNIFHSYVCLPEDTCICGIYLGQWNTSLTWHEVIWGCFPLTIIPVTLWWGRYTIPPLPVSKWPRFVCRYTYTGVYIYLYIHTHIHIYIYIYYGYKKHMCKTKVHMVFTATIKLQ